MKTITAKEFHTQHATILKNVSQGEEYEVTFHRKPLVRIIPMHPQINKKPKEGSRAAFLQSLQHTIPSRGDLHELSYKELRKRMVVEKYGR